MFRLVPFRNFNELDYIGNLYSLYKDCLERGSVLIQDSKDMVVEEFTLEQLREIESCNSEVFYQGFSTTEYCEEDELFSIESEYLDIQGENKFLNDTLEVICNGEILPESFWLYDLFNSVSDDEEPYVDVEEIIVRSNSSSFKLSMSSYFWESSERSLVLLCVNNEPLMFLDGGMLISEDYGYENYLELVQICKTKTGFDLVIYFPEVQGYFGVKLTEGLKLSKFVNIKPFVDEDLTNKNNWKDIRARLAKNKLLGESMGEVFCIE